MLYSDIYEHVGLIMKKHTATRTNNDLTDDTLYSLYDRWPHNYYLKLEDPLYMPYKSYFFRHTLLLSTYAKIILNDTITMHVM